VIIGQTTCLVGNDYLTCRGSTPPMHIGISIIVIFIALLLLLNLLLVLINDLLLSAVVSVVDFPCRLSNRSTLLLHIRICSHMVNILFRINENIFFGGHDVILSHA